MPGKKGQMFVITMIFLITMVFAVQSYLFTYAKLDLSTPLQARDTYTIKNIESAFQTALDSSTECEIARRNIIDLEGVLDRSIKGGQEVQITGSLDCPGGGWPPPPQLTLDILINRGEGGETQATLELTRT